MSIIMDIRALHIKSNPTYKFLFLIFIFFSISILNAQSDSCRSKDTTTLCFLSDTQEPLIQEKLLFSYKHNAKARTMIFERISSIAPNSVFHLGDLVGLGFDSDSWEETDNFIKGLALHNTQFYPIPGNHEYIIYPERSIANFRKHFKEINLTGFSKRYNDVAIVLFNSNFDNLKESEIKKQAEWYKKTIINFEADSTIDFIIVGTHHSPYTNSKIVEPGTESAYSEYFRQYLDLFYNSTKCKLFVSGHAHAY
jgi:hypothetical protein